MGDKNPIPCLIGAYRDLHSCCLSVLWMFRLCTFKICLRKGASWHLVLQAFQGQFSLPISFQGIGIYKWQTVGQFYIFLSLIWSWNRLSKANSFSLVVGTTILGFYGNIAVKVIYINIVEDAFKGPRFMSFKGRFVWMGRWAFRLF